MEMPNGAQPAPVQPLTELVPMASAALLRGLALGAELGDLSPTLAFLAQRALQAPVIKTSTGLRHGLGRLRPEHAHQDALDPPRERAILVEFGVALAALAPVSHSFYFIPNLLSCETNCYSSCHPCRVFWGVVVNVSSVMNTIFPPIFDVIPDPDMNKNITQTNTKTSFFSFFLPSTPSKKNGNDCPNQVTRDSEPAQAPSGALRPSFR